MSATDQPNSPSHSPDEPGDDGPSTQVNRRQLMTGAAAGTVGLAIAGLIGYEIHPSGAGAHPTTETKSGTSTTSTAASSTPAPTVAAEAGELQSFVTRPDLTPPAIKVNPAAAQPGTDSALPYILLSANNVVQGGPVQQGLMIIDRKGRLVYFKPIATKPFDFNAQSDRGRSVLSWWQGHLVSSHGAGVGEVMDSSYRSLPKIQAGNGLQIDLHELNMTSRGTVLITAYEQTTTSLKSIGGPAKGKVFASHAQEIDLKTGKVLLDWNSLDHVAVDESYAKPPTDPSKVMDYMHINSVAETSDGNLLISGRNTSALYKVDRTSGAVLWRLNGKKSDFKVAHDARFHWQHDARAWSDAKYTVFDNGANRTEKRSRGLLLEVNESARTVALTQAYLHPAAFVSEALGSVTLLPDGHVFVGWGDQPYFTEFAADGTLIFDGQMPINCRSYRALPSDWTGMPTEKPTVVARVNPAGGFVVRVSWNGATEVARWNVLSGTGASSMSLTGSQEWDGFETAIVVNSQGPSFQVVALDAAGKEIGRSEVV